VQDREIVRSGQEFNISITVESEGEATEYDLSVRDDQDFALRIVPSRVNISANRSVEALAFFFVPNGTAPGTVITVTIEARSTTTGDFNYQLIHLTVRNLVEDRNSPNCTIVQLDYPCPPVPDANCSLETWSLWAQLSDTGTGIVTIYSRLGNGTLETGVLPINQTTAIYNASCCFPEVELVAVDGVGNVGKCVVRVELPTTPQPSPTNQSTITSPSSGARGHSNPGYPWEFSSCLILTLLLYFQ
ncbi:uncharacterized protein LOC144490020, partial [Mustelus asterias]